MNSLSRTILRKIKDRLNKRQELSNYISIRSISYSFKQILVSYRSKLLNLNLKDFLHFYKIKNISINVASGVIQKNNIVIKNFISPIIYESIKNYTFYYFIFYDHYKFLKLKDDLIINNKNDLIYFDIKENKSTYYHFINDNLLRFIFILENYKEKFVILYNSDIAKYINDYMKLLSLIYNKKLIPFKNKNKIKIKGNTIFVHNSDYHKLGYYYDNSEKKNKIKKDNDFVFSVYNYPIKKFIKNKNETINNHFLQDINPSDYYSVLDEFLSKLLKTKKIVNKKKRNIYCKRLRVGGSSYKSRKVRNEHEFELFLKSKGFEIVIFDYLDITEQIDIMYNSKIVVGLFGSNLTNIIFKKTGNVIELTDKTDLTSKFYKNICEQRNINHYRLNFNKNKNQETLINYKLLGNLIDKLEK